MIILLVYKLLDYITRDYYAMIFIIDFVNWVGNS